MEKLINAITNRNTHKSKNHTYYYILFNKKLFKSQNNKTVWDSVGRAKGVFKLCVGDLVNIYIDNINSKPVTYDEKFDEFMKYLMENNLFEIKSIRNE